MGTMLPGNKKRNKFKTSLNNSAIHGLLPVGALKVNEKDVQGVRAQPHVKLSF